MFFMNKICIASDMKVLHGVLPKNCNVISFLKTKRAQNDSRKVNSFRESAIIVKLKWIYCNIDPAPIQTVVCKIEGLLKMRHDIEKFTKKSGADL